MRSPLRTLFLATAALGAAVVLYVWLTVPPRAITLGGAIPAEQVTGAYHLHSRRSDGTGTVDEIAAAAAAAGLKFIILTDHGDATRVPDPPSYRSGVLCIDAVEINTASGHVVALGFTQAAPYPLAGNALDVIEDIHRLGGVAVIAHPDSPRDSLRWRAMNAPYDGIEWLNADSEWRDETALHLLATAARALFRAPESVAALFAPPTRTLERWDRVARTRPIFGLAALDAHANIAWQDNDEPRRRTALARPSYESLFRTLAQSVILDAPLSGDARGDARRVLDAITQGRSFSIVRAFASPASLTFTADQSGKVARMGDRSLVDGVPTTFRASIPQAPGARVTLLHNGRVVATGVGQIERTENAVPAGGAGFGVYRVEAHLPDRSFPWLVSNPIFVGGVAPPSPPQPEAGQLDPATSIDMRTPDHPWTAGEHDATSTGALTIDGDSMRFAYRLGEGGPSGQFAALAGQVGTDAGIERVTFTARADKPMRVSLQIKLARGSSARRWRRSVYLDETPRAVTVDLQEFEPADVVTTMRPVVTALHSVLFVVDTVNTATGSAGTIWVSRVTLGVRQP